MLILTFKKIIVLFNMKNILNKFKNKNLKHYSKLNKLINYADKKTGLNINIKTIQEGYTNFYHPNSIQPYIPIAAAGPWILTNDDKIIYDTGGYGMLGLGHNPKRTKRNFEQRPSNGKYYDT